VPFVWVLALAAFYGDYASIPLVRAVVIGVGAAGAGLFIGTAVKLGRPLAKKPAAWVVVMGSFLAVAVGRVSLLLVVPVAFAIAIALSKWGKL
jgi:chromate transporter